MKKLNISFINVNGEELLSKMYDQFGEVEKENVIEDVYKMLTYKSSNMNVMTIKRGFYGTRETTDGYMTFALNGEERFYGIQEVKRKVCNTNTQKCKQLLQALRYLWLYRNDPAVKVIVLNSEKFYTYVLVDEIKELIEILDPLFKNSNKSASKTWEDHRLKNAILTYSIPFHSQNLDKYFELNERLESIYNDCL